MFFDFFFFGDLLNIGLSPPPSKTHVSPRVPIVILNKK